MKRELYILMLLLLMALPLSDLLCVFPASEYKNFKILNNNDTALFTKRHGDWWLGIDIGTNMGLFFGTLKIPRDPNLEVNIANPLIEYNAGSGTGLYGGINIEYLPVGKKIGAMLKAHFLDFKPSKSSSNIIDPTTKEMYFSEFKNYFINIAPGFVYNIYLPYFNLYGGIDFDILISEKIKIYNYFVNSADIYYDSHLEPKSKKLRLGLFFGLSYDINVADISNVGRVFLTPNASFHGGTNIFSEFNSSRNMMMFRLGVNARVCFDVIKSSTMKFNSEDDEHFEQLAELQDRPVRFRGFDNSNRQLTMELDAVQKPIINQQIGEEPKIESSASASGRRNQVGTQIPSITPNTIFKYHYARSENTTLTPELRNYLDGIADYLKQNPRATVRVEGHSDNQGSIQQNTQRALDRAKEVVDYLLAKKISRGRILDRGRGSLQAASTNLTPEGRKKNRRVEIQVIQ